MSKQQRTIKKHINNTSTNFEKCADLHCSHIIKTSELFKLAMNSLGKSKSKKVKYNTKFKQRMQCIDEHCSEAKNKFNTVINIVESQLLVHPKGVGVMDSRSSVGVYDKSAPHGTVKIPNLQKNKKTKKQNTNNKNHNTQHAGASQLTDQNISSQIITAINGTPELITAINNALQNYDLQKLSTKDKIKALQETYSTSIIGTQLFDLIYTGQKLTHYDSAKNPSLIWNHGVNNSKSITAGKLGTHIYVYKDSNTNLFKLLGVIIRKDKMGLFDKISNGLTFMGF